MPDYCSPYFAEHRFVRILTRDYYSPYFAEPALYSDYDLNLDLTTEFKKDPLTSSKVFAYTTRLNQELLWRAI